jgi:hypothetical protein
LKDLRGIRLEIVLRMLDAGSSAHHLHVPGFGTSAIAEAVLVGDRALPDIGNDFHVGVRVRREATFRRDLVVVPDAQRARFSFRIIVTFPFRTSNRPTSI